LARFQNPEGSEISDDAEELFASSLLLVVMGAVLSKRGRVLQQMADGAKKLPAPERQSVIKPYRIVCGSNHKQIRSGAHLVVPRGPWIVIAFESL